MPDSSDSADSDSDGQEDFILSNAKNTKGKGRAVERKLSVNMPVPFTEAIIKRLSTGGIRPDQAMILAQEAEYKKRMEVLDSEMLEGKKQVT